MANIPNFTRIRPEDFPDLEWLPQFADPINRFMEEIIRALTRKLRINDNFEGVTRTVTIDGTYPVKFVWDFPNKPVAAWIGQAREINEDHTTITTALYLDWEFISNSDGSFLQINNVAGLSASGTNKFNVTILAITG